MTRIKTAFLTWMVLAIGMHSVSAAESAEVFKIPYNKIERYQPSMEKELVESTLMSRIRLKGKKDLIYDPTPNLFWQRDYQAASVAFYNHLDPKLRYEVITFSADQLSMDFGVDLLTAYLRDKEQTYVESNFEVLLAPEKTTKGPARFRILGKRALSFTYSYTIETGSIFRGENWIEEDGLIHVVAIEAPSRRAFDFFFEQIRQAMNSLRYAD